MPTAIAKTIMNGRMQNKLPRRWGEERVRTVLAHYDRQTEDEVASEIDAAFEKMDRELPSPSDPVLVRVMP
jgi:hypothetical protein